MLKFPLDSLQKSVYATLAFFDILDFPLTAEEIQHYFLGNRPSPGVLNNYLLHNVDIEHKMVNGHVYYFLQGRKKIVDMRLERKKISYGFWKKVRFFLPFIQLVPFVKMVSVCNTLAFNNATKDSDIDLFIVAKRGRLFIVRFLTFAIFSLLGVRRHNKKIAGRFCLSFYVDETCLNLKTIQISEKDIYLPFWIVIMKPIYGQKTYEKFLDANSWIKTYFGRTPEGSQVQQWGILKCFGYLFELPLRGRFGDFIERKFEVIQQKRYKKNVQKLDSKASVIVEKHILKFHNIDKREEIARRFKKSLSLIT